jgi:hypothetical protein
LPRKRDGPASPKTTTGPEETENAPFLPRPTILCKPPLSARASPPASHHHSTIALPAPPVESAQRHQTFGPQAIAVGHFLTAEAGLIPDDDVLAALAEIRKRWPALSFRDFWGAAVLAQALALKPRGSA